MFLDDYKGDGLTQRSALHDVDDVAFFGVDAGWVMCVKTGTSPFIPSIFGKIEGIVALYYYGSVHSILNDGPLKLHASY